MIVTETDFLCPICEEDYLTEYEECVIVCPSCGYFCREESHQPVKEEEET